MTNEEIISMAREAGGEDWGIFRDFIPEIERFAKLVEKRKCEELADKIAKMPFGDTSASFAIWVREQQ